MSDFVLDVYRDRYDTYQLVGHLSTGEEGGEGAPFVYDGRYLIHPDAHAISVALPLADTPYEGRRVREWFGALVPEGREMGVSLTMSGRIDDVRRVDLETACKRVGVAPWIGMDVIDELRIRLPGATEAARDFYRAQGIAGVDGVAEKLLDGIRNRVSATRP